MSVKTKEQNEEEDYKRKVLRAHNIEVIKDGFICNDGDIFKSVWEALDHTIWLDLKSKTINDDGKERECNDYYEIIKESPSYQSKLLKKKKYGRLNDSNKKQTDI